MAKIVIDTTNLKKTKDKLSEQVAANPLAAAAVGAGFLNGSAALMNALTKRKNAKTQAKNAKAWTKEVNRRDRQTK